MQLLNSAAPGGDWSFHAIGIWAVRERTASAPAQCPTTTPQLSFPQTVTIATEL